MKKNNQLIRPAVFILAIASTSLAFAHGGATGIVKDRMDSMSAMGKAMKTIIKELKSKSNMDSDLIIKSSQLIIKHSSMIPQMFPQGTHGKPSEALPTIWSEWDTFTSMAEDTGSQAGNMQKLTESEAPRPQLMKQFATLGKTCKGCHTDFRAEKE